MKHLFHLRKQPPEPYPFELQPHLYIGFLHSPKPKPYALDDPHLFDTICIHQPHPRQSQNLHYALNLISLNLPSEQMSFCFLPKNARLIPNRPHVQQAQKLPSRQMPPSLRILKVYYFSYSLFDTFSA